METLPQFLQEKQKSLKTQFLRDFLFILRRFLKFLRGFRFSPDNYFWGISQYFWGISKIFEAFPYFYKLHLIEVFSIFLRRFRKIFEVFPYFWKLHLVEVLTIFILMSFCFNKKISKLQLLESISLFPYGFPEFLEEFVFLDNFLNSL